MKVEEQHKVTSKSVEFAKEKCLRGIIRHSAAVHVRRDNVFLPESSEGVEPSSKEGRSSPFFWLKNRTLQDLYVNKIIIQSTKYLF